MDPNEQDLLNSTDLLNFNWIIEKFNEHEVYSSKSFNIAGIPNVKWFIKISPQCGDLNHIYIPNHYSDLIEKSEIRVFNNISQNYLFKNPVDIKLKLGIDSNTNIFIRTTKEIKELKFVIGYSELIELCSKTNNGLLLLHVNLNIQEAKIKTKSTTLTSSSCCKNFKPFFLSNVLSDFVFQIDDKKFPVHKVVLASVSPVFEKMFSVQMKENITNICEIKDIDADIFIEMLNYIYMDKITNLKTLALGLYELSNKYYISELRIICEQYLQENLSVENVITILEHAELYESTNLKKECIKYIDENFEKVKETENLQKLGTKLLVELCSAMKSAKIT
ncbi:speckle-type POZ protein B-like [Leptopilina boulardi]|uniref:speckle-type POZ protein B-like n=1 Tax=Leptopilina boulardi TaxID=63433 RepID=UPI0021F5FAB7|nr:speckle-type POZ protein B-like [Leptopilina boulardi]XP_051161491.1 speckle-type POZ protein B-like [Leptopilina boulardi]